MFRSLGRMFLLWWTALKSRKPGLYFVLFCVVFPILSMLGLFAFIVPWLPLREVWHPLVCFGPPLVFFAIYFTLSSASRIMMSWYGADRDEAFEIMLAHTVAEGYTRLRAFEGKLDVDDKPEEVRKDIRLKLSAGLPVVLTVDADTAVLTEREGRPHRAYLRGKHRLAPFEEIRAVIDLRPQHAKQEGARAMTRDGIHVTMDVGVGFNVRREGNPSARDPYPVDVVALHRLVYKPAVFAGKQSPPHILVPALAAGQLRDVVAQYRFTELFEHSVGSPQDVPRTRLASEVRDRLEPIAEDFGLQINSVALGPVGVDEQVYAHVLRDWMRERGQEIERRVSPEEAKIKANEIAILLKALEKASDGKDVSEVVRDVQRLYYLVQDLAEIGSGAVFGLGDVDDLQTADLTGRLMPGSFGDASDPRQKAYRWKRRANVLRVLRDIEQGRISQEEGEWELARRFPDLIGDDE
jgi:regulator of protease activity HflC (stomatin/prohibitin superfamily)